MIVGLLIGDQCQTNLRRAFYIPKYLASMTCYYYKLLRLKVKIVLLSYRLNRIYRP